MVPEVEIDATILLHADGSRKLEPWIISKVKIPRYFKSKLLLPCIYTHNKSAWINSQTFRAALPHPVQLMEGSCVEASGSDCMSAPEYRRRNHPKAGGSRRETTRDTRKLRSRVSKVDMRSFDLIAVLIHS
ncbi:hypothetical protein LAZ67_4003855 [Cordylochernes scorpioides]|uniref:DDE-1 domain-containing protein n=1 Tax=Cordylochernes scorpioides TaxID=51811 RepID=A0ABY6KF20_9ARAC|nr:hypothetical protein LAZ67_4003855 [Cordylochernes scorpioides]